MAPRQNVYPDGSRSSYSRGLQSDLHIVQAIYSQSHDLDYGHEYMPRPLRDRRSQCYMDVILATYLVDRGETADDVIG